MGTILEKPIVDTKESQSKNLDRIDTTQGLIDQLKIQNISDLGDSRLTIKQDRQKYIFAIDGEDAFYVNGKKLLERLIGDFYEQQSTDETRVVVETTNLKLKILAGTDPSIQRASETQNNAFDKALDVDDFKRRLDTYKEFFEAQIDDVKWQAFWLNPKYSGKEKAAYRITKQAAEQHLKTLKKIEQRVNTILKPGRFQHIENLDYESRTTLLQLSEQLDSTVSSIPDFVSFRNDIIMGNMDTVPYFGTKINSIADAQRFASILKQFNRQELKINQYAADAATQQQYAQILQSLEAYFENNINNPSGFTPYAFNAQQLVAMNYFPALKQAMGDIKPKDQEQSNTEGTNSNTASQNNSETQNNNDTTNSNINTNNSSEKPVEYKDWKDALAKGGVAGLLETTVMKNMTPEQKQTWEGVGNLAITGATIFVGWKFLSTAWKALSKKGREDLDTNGGWNWLWLPPAAIFAANATTGESPLAILKGGKSSTWLAGLFGGSKTTETPITNSANIENPAETQEKMVDDVANMTSAMALFNGKNGSEIAQAIQLDQTSGKMKLKSDVYDSIIQDAKNNPNDSGKQASAAALEKIGKDDSNNIIDMGLTLCGFSYESLTSSSASKDIFNDKAANSAVRIAQLTKFMRDNNMDRININQYPLIRTFIANPSGSQQDLTNLLARGDVFENSKELPPEDVRKAFQEQINKLDISDSEKGRLLASVNTFWHLWPTDNANKDKLQIIQEGKNILLKTYGQEVKIDLINNSLPGLLDKNDKEIRFSSTVELLKAANLVNRAFDLTKELANPPTPNPFNISLFGRDVEYDNTKFYSSVSDKYNHKDITIVSGGIGGALQGISSTLEENKSSFVNYLNKEYNRIHNVK